MNILKFKTNRSQNAYKISLNIKRFINQWTKQFYLVNFSKRLSLITRIPKDVILFEIKQILSSNFSFSRGIFTRRLSTKYLIFDGFVYLCILFFCILFSKNNSKSKEYTIIIDDIEFELQAERFGKLIELTKNSILICKKKILFEKKSSKKFNIKKNGIFKFYDRKFLYGKRLNLFMTFFVIFYKSIKYNVNLFFIFNKLLYKIVDSETLFSQIKSKILIIDRFYKTSAIKNYVFKKNGGLITSCTQKNICQFNISFFINIDIFFSLGKDFPLIIKKLGGKIGKFVASGSLYMEHTWYNQKKDLKKIPKADLLIFGINYAHAPERMYIDKHHYENYYKQFEWAKKISLKYPKLNVILKHHNDYRGDEEEVKILTNSRVKTVVGSPSINSSYAYMYKAKQVFSWGSTMVLENVSIGKLSYFIDPNLQNIAFHKSIPKAKKMRIRNYNEFEKKVMNNFKKNISTKTKNSDLLCLKSDNVSQRIVKFFRKNKYLV